MKSLRATLLAGLFACAFTACSDSESTAPLAQGEIGPAGGAVSSSDGRITLTFPPGALTETHAFTVTEYEAQAPEEGVQLPAFRVEPGGLSFAVPVRVTLSRVLTSGMTGFDNVRVTAEGESDLTNQWEFLKNVSVVADGTLEGETTHFSGFRPSRMCRADMDCLPQHACFARECALWRP